MSIEKNKNILAMLTCIYIRGIALLADRAFIDIIETLPMSTAVIRVCLASSNTLPLTITQLSSVIGKLRAVHKRLQFCNI